MYHEIFLDTIVTVIKDPLYISSFPYIVKGLAEKRLGGDQYVDIIPGKKIKSVKKVVGRIRTVVVWRYLVERMRMENGLTKVVLKLL